MEFESMNKVIRITADSSTFDNNLGDSYRVLQIFKKSNHKLTLIKRVVLNINQSPDYPYRLNFKFDGNKKFVIVTGVTSFYIYDANSDSITKKIVPTYPPNTEDFAQDSQTGHLRELKLSEDGKMFSGLALDFGNFSFDLTDPLNPKEIEAHKR